jgi:hypothetical protein
MHKKKLSNEEYPKMVSIEEALKGGFDLVDWRHCYEEIL